MRIRLASLVSAALLGIAMPAGAQFLPVSALEPAQAPAPGAVAVAQPEPALSVSDDRPLGQWSGGAGVYVVMPYFQSNAAYIQRRGINGNEYINQVELNQQVDVAPLAFVAFTFDNGWGARFRWFELESQASGGFYNTNTTGSTYIYAPGGAGGQPDFGDHASGTEHFGLNVFDIEATNNFKFGSWSLLAFAGVRIAHIGQSIDGTGANIDNTDVAVGSTTNDFNGAGPTFGIETRRQVGDTDFFFYGSARGSVLFGCSHQDASGGVFGLDNGSGALSASEATVVSAGEFEIGGEWTRQLNDRLSVFVQAGLVGQIWWGVGNASQIQSLYTYSDSNIHSAVGPGGNFGLFGGVFRAGISF